MNAIEKRDAALKLLASTGIWRVNYAPPLLHLLWHFGFDVPPPHFCTFSRNALFTGSFFAAALVLFMTPFCLMFQTPALPALCGVLVAGLLFGLGMASYYAYGKWKHRLPDWKDFHPEGKGS